MPFSDR